MHLNSTYIMSSYEVMRSHKQGWTIPDYHLQLAIGKWQHSAIVVTAERIRVSNIFNYKSDVPLFKCFVLQGRFWKSAFYSDCIRLIVCMAATLARLH